MSWRKHTERPESYPVSVLIAVGDEWQNYCLLANLYTWSGKEFRNEETDQPLSHEAFWWMPEEDLLQMIEGISQ